MKTMRRLMCALIAVSKEATFTTTPPTRNRADPHLIAWIGVAGLVAPVRATRTAFGCAGEVLARPAPRLAANSTTIASEPATRANSFMRMPPSSLELARGNRQAGDELVRSGAGQLRCGSGLLWSAEIIRPASTVDPMRLCAACATVIGELAVVAANLAHPLAPSPSGTTLAAFINVSGLPFPNEGHLEGALQAPVLLAVYRMGSPDRGRLVPGRPGVFHCVVSGLAGRFAAATAGIAISPDAESRQGHGARSVTCLARSFPIFQS